MYTGNIIFDMDGTLWDSSENVAASWTSTIRRSGVSVLRNMVLTRADIQGIMGLAMDEIAAKLFPDLSPTRRAAVLDACTEDENNYLAVNGGVLYDNEEEILERLTDGRRLFIVSNCQCGYIEAFFEYTGFERFFSDYLCWGDTLKPKGETIKRLIEKNNCVNSVYVGDTRGDYLAALSAGIPFIHAAYGFGKLLPGDTPAEVISSLAELDDKALPFRDRGN